MIIANYINGNCNITLHDDGTRIIDSNSDSIILEYPLNIDIRVQSKCAFGMRSDGSLGLCNFCHESAMVNGSECDYYYLYNLIADLPKGIELAIGCNEFTESLYDFLNDIKELGFIANITINQGHLLRDIDTINKAIENNLIKGLGISYRSSLKWNIPESLLNYSNTVFHVICGIDNINDIKKLADKGVKKILILGEKSFGFNENKVDLNSRTHKEWYWWVYSLFSLFDIVSFDNLGIEQLNVKRFFNDTKWNNIYNGEHSMYINAVDKYFAPSSRSSNKLQINNLTIKQYFQILHEQ